MAYSLGLVTTPIKVSTVAEAMLQDAWTHHNTQGDNQEAASNTSPIFGNADIHRLCNVNNTPHYWGVRKDFMGTFSLKIQKSYITMCSRQ